MGQSLTITVAIPVFNAEKYLSQAIKSVLNQSFRDFELIITDDGSTDRSLEIANSFTDDRIIIISEGLNRGISYRLNQQIDMARGKYFCRMDADDIMFPDRLKRQVEFLEAHPDIDILGTQAVIIDESNHPVGIRRPVLPAGVADCFKSVAFIHPTVMGKTSWFRQFGYTDELIGVEDADLWIRSFGHTQYGIIREPLLFYRDPLKFNMKTYRFRIQQLARMYEANAKYCPDRSFIRYLKWKNQVKYHIYKMAQTIGFEQLIIKRRNQFLKADEVKHYEELLLLSLGD